MSIRPGKGTLWPLPFLSTCAGNAHPPHERTARLFTCSGIDILPATLKAGFTSFVVFQGSGLTGFSAIPYRNTIEMAPALHVLRHRPQPKHICGSIRAKDLPLWVWLPIA